MHFYSFHIKDYRAKTAHLTPLEHYVYRTLIDWYYLNEKPFETVEQIARYLLLPLTDENTKAINTVLDEFFHYHKGKYHHKRINQEIKNYRHKNGGNVTGNGEVTGDNGQSNAQGNGKNNGNALSVSERQARYKERKKMINSLFINGITLDVNASFEEVSNAYNAQGNGSGNAEVTDKVTQNNGKNDAITINHKPITITNTPLTPQGDVMQDEPAGFQRFWEAYPNTNGRRKDKHKCLNYWRKYKLEGIADSIVQHVKAMTNTKKWRDGYEPLTMSYLNGRQWLDGLPDETHKPASTAKQHDENDEFWYINGKFDPFTYVNRKVIAEQRRLSKEQHQGGLRPLGEIIDVTPPQGVVNALQ